MTINIETRISSIRKLRLKILTILKTNAFRDGIRSLIEAYSAKMISPLFSASYNPSKQIQWHAVTSFGYLANHLATNDLPKVRDIMRRCIWMLTDESGGIPWMAPAIMGEIMANNIDMAKEYSSILLSYVYEPEKGPENFLDTLPLRINAYWGIFRLTQTHPEVVKENEKIIFQRFIREYDPDSIILLCLILANTGLNMKSATIKEIISENWKAEVYINERFEKLTINDLDNLTKHD